MSELFNFHYTLFEITTSYRVFVFGRKMRSDNDILYANDGLSMTVVYTLCTLQERVIKLTMSFNNARIEGFDNYDLDHFSTCTVSS